jgi:hypothetical protein
MHRKLFESIDKELRYFTTFNSKIIVFDPDCESGSRQAKNFTPKKGKMERFHFLKSFLLGWRPLLKPELPVNGVKKTNMTFVIKKLFFVIKKM